MQQDNPSNSSRLAGYCRSGLRNIVVSSLMLAGWHLAAFSRLDLADTRGFESAPGPGAEQAQTFARPSFQFKATAYCEYGITKSGVPVRPGIVAGDPSVLPLGSVIYVVAPGYSGFYEVLDTGRLVKGKRIDIYIPDLRRAVKFGLQRVRVMVYRYGFLPKLPAPAGG